MGTSWVSWHYLHASPAMGHRCKPHLRFTPQECLQFPYCAYSQLWPRRPQASYGRHTLLQQHSALQLAPACCGCHASEDTDCVSKHVFPTCIIFLFHVHALFLRSVTSLSYMKVSLCGMFRNCVFKSQTRHIAPACLADCPVAERTRICSASTYIYPNADTLLT